MSETTVTVSNSAASSNPDYPVAVDNDGTRNYQEVKLTLGAPGVNDGPVSASNPVPVTASSLPLPSGAATSANQTTIIGHVDGIEGSLSTISTTLNSQATAANQATLISSASSIDSTLSSLKRAEDAAAASGDSGIAALAVRRDSDGAQTNATGDYENLQTDASGYLKVSNKTALPTGTNTIGSVKLTDGTSTATVSSAVDSRNALDTRISSAVSKNIANFNSTSGGLGANGTKIFSPGGTRATYFDTDGYGLLRIAFIDNSAGASGGSLYIRWSHDGTNTAFNDPGDGTGGSNYDLGVNPSADGLTVVGRLIPLAARYVNFVYIQGSQAQGTTYPNVCEIRLDLLPTGFTSRVNVANSSLLVSGVGTTNQAGVLIAGFDSVSSPTAVNPVLVSAAGAVSVDSELPAAAALADSKANPTTPIIANAPYVWNGSTWDRQKSAVNALNSTGTGLPQAVLVGQYDDVSPTAVTENQFAHVRTSSRRALYNAADTAVITLHNGNSPASATTTAQTAVTDLGQYRSMTVYASIQGGTGGTLDIYIQMSPDAGTTWIDYAHFAQLAAGAAAITRSFSVCKDSQALTISTIGTGTTPALAANTVLGGNFGDRLRVVYVAGAGTSAGKAQTIFAVLST